MRVDRQDANKARGPTWARFLQQQLLKDEEFCLQLDSHSLFGANWDTWLIRDWLSTKNERAVLSTYLANIDQIDLQTEEGSTEQTVPHICRTVWGGYGMVRNDQV